MGTVQAGGGAEISPCGLFRLRLWRRWSADGWLVFVMLNPSSADARRDDATLRACISFAKAAGCGGLEVVNLFSLRATDPRALKHAADPVGPGNDDAIVATAARPSTVVCGWGRGGALLGRGALVSGRLRQMGIRLHHLGLTKDGAPRHPLYVARSVAPKVWEAGST